MKTKLVKKLGVLALCGTLFCNAFGVTANAKTNDYLTATMKWSGLLGTKCTVKTSADYGYRGYTACAYVFAYNSKGTLLGSKSDSAKWTISTSINKSKTAKAMGVHYIQGAGGDVYGYEKLEAKKGTPY